MKQNYGWTLPEKISVRLGQSSYGRQRALFEDGHLLLVLHNPKLGQVTREAIVFWRRPDGEWQCNGQGEGLFRLKRFLATYEGYLSELEAEYRSSYSPKLLFVLLEKLNPLRRAAINSYEALQSGREMVKLDADIIEARDRAYEIQRSLDLLFEDVKNRLNFKLAENSEKDAQTNREAVQAQHRLNIMAAIFFPLTALSAVFSMNLPTGMNAFGASLFWGVFFSGLVGGLFFRGWVLKK